MSWNWNPIEEEKEYDTKGTVTISTEEYRDLIRRTYELKTQGQKEHDDWYEQYRECERLKKDMETTKNISEGYVRYINSTETRKSDYALYLRELKLRELDEIDEEGEV